MASKRIETHRRSRKKNLEQKQNRCIIAPNPKFEQSRHLDENETEETVNQLVMKNKTQFAKSFLLSVLTACSVVSTQAAIHSYTVSFGPASGVTTSGSGSGTLDYDDVGHVLTLQASWSGLTGNTTVSHIHLPTATPFSGNAGVVITPGTLTDFPAGVTSGTYSKIFDMTSSSTYPAAYITANGGTTAGAEAAVITAFNEGRAYWNIHTSFAGGGEINGFVTLVPEPSSLALAGLGIAAIATRVWSKRRAKIS